MTDLGRIAVVQAIRNSLRLPEAGSETQALDQRIIREGLDRLEASLREGAPVHSSFGDFTEESIQELQPGARNFIVPVNADTLSSHAVYPRTSWGSVISAMHDDSEFMDHITVRHGVGKVDCEECGAAHVRGIMKRVPEGILSHVGCGFCGAQEEWIIDLRLRTPEEDGLEYLDRAMQTLKGRYSDFQNEHRGCSPAAGKIYRVDDLPGIPERVRGYLPSVEEFVRQRLAEPEENEIIPTAFLFLQTPDGEGQVAILPIGPMPISEALPEEVFQWARRCYIQLLHSMFRTSVRAQGFKVQGAVFISEAWVRSAATAKRKGTRGSIEQDADKEEVIIFSVLGGGRCYSAVQGIERYSATEFEGAGAFGPLQFRPGAGGQISDGLLATTQTDTGAPVAELPFDHFEALGRAANHDSPTYDPPRPWTPERDSEDNDD